MHLKQKHPHLQVILSIGGGSSSEIYPIVAGNAYSRDNFAKSARGLVEASGLDGIDSARPPLWSPIFLGRALLLQELF
jgi:chitinase